MVRLHTLRIVRYTDAMRKVWDDFVGNAKNVTFLHRRDYMEYHSDRFCDHSLMFYRGNSLVALLPAHVDCNGMRLCSHNGLTYGGLLMSHKVTTRTVLDIFSLLSEYMCSNSMTTLIYKPVPAIYHIYPAEEDLYALFRNGARLVERKVSSVVPLSRHIDFSTLRRRKVRRASNAGCIVEECDDLAAFWMMLTDTLMSRHGVSPVHSLEEMTRLKRLFPDNILLFMTRKANGEPLSGTLIYLTNRVAHVQYIASTYEGRRCGAVDLMFSIIIKERFRTIEYLDFGTSVEHGGTVLNDGLIFQKEGFGGRAVVYDTYQIDIK